MKRPVAVIGLGYLITAAVAACFSATVCLWAALVLGVGGVVVFALLRAPVRQPLAASLLGAGIACMAVFLALTFQWQPTRALAGLTEEVSGRVSAVKGARAVEIKQENGMVIALSAREDIDVQMGDRLRATAALSFYEVGTPGAYARIKARTVPLRGFILGDYTVTPPARGSRGALLSTLRQRMSNALRRLLPKEQGRVLAAMLLGQRGLVPRETNRAYAAAGISHLIAISGYHFAILTSLFYAIFSALRLPRRVAALATAGVALGYMVLVGFTPSVTRAGIMVILYLVGTALGRRGDPLTSLALAGLVICGISPLAATDVSLQLSFLATLGIILLAAPLQTRLEKHLGKARLPKLRSFFLSALCMTLCATVATLPVILLEFEQFPLYSPVANLLAAPLMPPAMLCGFGAMLLGAIPFAPLQALAVPLAFVAGSAITVLSAVARLLAGLPFAVLPMGAGFVPLWLAGAAGILALAWVRHTPQKTAAAVCLCGITLLLGTLSYQLALRGATQITILETGKTGTMLAVKDRHAVIVGDITSKNDVYAVEQALRAQLIDCVDLFALRPTTARRNGAVSTLLGKYPVHTAVLGAEALADERFVAACAELPAVWRWGDSRITLLGGDTLLLTENEIYAEFNGIKTLILAGECDILNCIEVYGVPELAVFAGLTPRDPAALGDGWLVSTQEAAAEQHQKTVLLAQPRTAAQFLLQEGTVTALG